MTRDSACIFIGSEYEFRINPSNIIKSDWFGRRGTSESGIFILANRIDIPIFQHDSIRGVHYYTTVLLLHVKVHQPSFKGNNDTLYGTETVKDISENKGFPYMQSVLNTVFE
ncbi:hypothetical protein TNCV_1382621 [Trichonephila clavipes]|nr:hypothetical protein TNCV_1382621 [Trichonephila clavipes]